ncbi:uncharacterized protein RSE6_11143 [Rhynchosporium secalis]|uniref:Uncharacterized protein n=1 Tax=Rhynchosporium secalis TaxID=38038 RepID=A0A1E1MM88_RHYSE|nr:uncharacterized protein RSE6_11143 [Rhynchosporium secalis]
MSLNFNLLHGGCKFTIHEYIIRYSLLFQKEIASLHRASLSLNGKIDQTFVMGPFPWSTEENSDDQIMKLTIRCFGACFEILYLAPNLRASPHLLARHEESLRNLRVEDGGDCSEIDKGIKEIYRLWQPFQELLTQKGPELTNSASLFNFLYAPQFILEALIPTSSNPQAQPCLRGYSKLVATSTVGTEKVCYFKACGTSIVRKRLRGEPWRHKQIAAAIQAKIIGPNIRICRLRGVVLDGDPDVLQHFYRASEKELKNWDEGLQTGIETNEVESRRLVGILINYIENKATLYHLAPRPDYLDVQRRAGSMSWKS